MKRLRRWWRLRFGPKPRPMTNAEKERAWRYLEGVDDPPRAGDVTRVRTHPCRPEDDGDSDEWQSEGSSR